MVHVTCSALHCPSSSRTHDVKFHQLPHDPKRRKIWLKACKRTDVIDREASFFKNKYVCSLHFPKCMYTKKEYLRKTAVPSLYLSAKPMQHDSCTQTEEFKPYVEQKIEEQQYQNNLSILSVKNSFATHTQNEDPLPNTIHDVDVKEEPEFFEPDVAMETDNNDDADYENSDLDTFEDEEEMKPDIGETEILALGQSTQALQCHDYLRFNIHSGEIKKEIITQTNTEESQLFKLDAEIKTENDDDVSKNCDLETTGEDVKIKLVLDETKMIPLPQPSQFLKSDMESFKTVEIKSENNVDGNCDSDSSEYEEIKPDIGETEILVPKPCSNLVDSDIIKELLAVQVEASVAVSEADCAQRQPKDGSYGLVIIQGAVCSILSFLLSAT
ncbi:hypothetical protein PYW08_003284 [Mythimna loreyi]|uniref:Uncharacterized protein n=1 Tax=Mythimna loreyi TaxID=667449 RepID=A0ACC2QRR7_9NEOP|nr:hypothetical protein PYW08_003284 [Mythimna loreyi]